MELNFVDGDNPVYLSHQERLKIAGFVRNLVDSRTKRTDSIRYDSNNQTNQINKMDNNKMNNKIEYKLDCSGIPVPVNNEKQNLDSRSEAISDARQAQMLQNFYAKRGIVTSPGSIGLTTK